ncbi:MAG TPA: molybdopterin oxidoreductase family protein [Candidatus Acidoferrum sp.]|nr:molybdopterin oxidoreductase family protein [Candidatus Acidoferrum sp.]
MRTHCPYCALQCAMRIVSEGETYRTEGDPSFEINGGDLCVKGFTAAATLRHPERLTTPLVREDGRLRPASWDEALDRAAEGFRLVAAGQGEDANAVFGSGALTNEKAYALGKFARLALRTSSFDYNGRFCMSSAAAAVQRSLGIDRGLPFPLAWLAQTACLFIAGANPLATMPPLARYLDAQHAHGSSIVVDPRRTDLAARATIHLQPAPGTDAILATGLLHVLIAEGRVDGEYVTTRTRGFEVAKRLAEREYPERVERLTGVAAEAIRAAARMLADAPSAIVLTARGVEQHANGTATVNAFVNLALALGLPGREHSGFGTLTGQGNGQGGREHGQKSDQLPGYRRAGDARARAHVAKVWGVEPDDVGRQGERGYDLLAGAGDAVRGMLVVGSNPIVSAPNASVIREAFARLDHLVVCDFFPSETTEYAHVVLPTLQWAEESGTMTNLEGRVLLREAVVSPAEGARSDLAILRALALRLGHPEGACADEPEGVFEELRRASAGGVADYSGISYARLRAGERLQWPVVSVEHAGTPTLFTAGFPTDDGLARFVADEARASAEMPDTQYPWYFTTGRLREHYLSGTQTRRVATLSRAAPEPRVEMHPRLAALIGVREGERVKIVSRRGAVELQARITDGIRHDTLFAPFHWGGALSVNVLVDERSDPHSAMPAFKACAVRVERVPNA